MICLQSKSMACSKALTKAVYSAILLVAIPISSEIVEISLPS